MNSMEIFALFVRGTGPYKSYSIDNEIELLTFSKKPRDLAYKFHLETGASTIIPIINDNVLTLDELLFVEDSGYIIRDLTWFPVSRESLTEFKKIYSKSKGLKIETNLALKLMQERSLDFIEKENRNIVDVFNEQESSLTKEQSSLFVQKLYDYQERGVAWLKFCVANKIGTILGDDMGLGKTAQIIALISWLIENKITKKILIVVPSTLLENWRREFEFFAPSIIPCIHHGHLRIGIASEFKNFDVVITSYSLVINDVYILNDIEWDLTILDEASLIKNPESERTKKIKDLNSRVRIAMTGTPVENSLLDLWSIVDYCYPEYFLPLTEFKNRYVSRSIEETLENDLSELREQTRMIMLRRMKIDILDSLPDKIDIHHPLVMSDYERREYDRIKDEIIRNAESNQEVCFKLISDLRQFTSHPLLINPVEDKRERFNNLKNLSVKFQRTVEILDEIKESGEKVLIFTGFIGMIDLFKEFLAERYGVLIYGIDGRVETEERQKEIDRFSSTVGFSIMVLNPTTAAMGLNITAANHVIHYTRQWNPAIEIQASARAYRNGQKKGVNIYYLFYGNSIEEVMDQRLRAKEALSEEVVSIVEHSTSEMEEMLTALKEI